MIHIKKEWLTSETAWCDINLCNAVKDIWTTRRLLVSHPSKNGWIISVSSDKTEITILSYNATVIPGWTSYFPDCFPWWNTGSTCYYRDLQWFCKSGMFRRRQRLPMRSWEIIGFPDFGKAISVFWNLNKPAEIWFLQRQYLVIWHTGTNINTDYDPTT